MKTLKDFVMEVTFEEVADVFKKSYPNDWNAANNPEGFEMVFNVLREKEPVPRKDDMKILIYHVIQDWGYPELETEEYDHVCGYTESDNQKWGLDYTPWAEWLGMEIHTDTVQNYSPAEIVAHCLWELTWNGFTEEEINKKKEGLMKRFDEAVKKFAKMFNIEEEE